MHTSTHPQEAGAVPSLPVLGDGKQPAALNVNIVEYADAKGAKQIFGFSRAHLYNLIKEGKIRSSCIRRPGAFRGRRLFDCASIRAFLEKNIEGAQ